MTWNYRVIKTPVGFSVYEVYYDDAGLPIGTTADPVLDFFCDTPEGLIEELEIIRVAFDKPPLDQEEIGKGVIDMENKKGQNQR